MFHTIFGFKVRCVVGMEPLPTCIKLGVPSDVYIGPIHDYGGCPCFDIVMNDSFYINGWLSLKARTGEPLALYDVADLFRGNPDFKEPHPNLRRYGM